MNSIKINNITYYRIDIIQKSYPKLFKGCKTTKIFIDKHTIPENKYIYARKKDNKWVISDGNSRKFDKLFVSKKWFHEKFPDSNLDNQSDTIEMAPDIIELEDHEKFQDTDGNIIEIEVRGERRYNKCYFRLRDVAAGFGLDKLHSVVTDKKRNGYIKNRHYKYFYTAKTNNDGNGKIKKLYLTYIGLLRVLFASRGAAVDKFVDWASKTLFTSRMGSSDQKKKLASNLLGVSIEAVKQVFNKTVNKLPCIYLLSIGCVKDLRKTLNIGDKYNDKDYVYKYGRTEDLERRIKEHERTYGKLQGSQLELIINGFIDPQYVAEAETKLKHIFWEMNLSYDHAKHKELAIIPAKKMDMIKEQYDLISQAYMGHISTLMSKLKDKNAEIDLLKERHKNELLMMEKALLTKEKDFYAKENELLKKECELLRLQAQSQNKQKKSK